jgi:hypothetical protein
MTGFCDLYILYVSRSNSDYILYIYVLLVFNEKSLKIPKEVNRIRKPKKNKQHNGQNKKYNGTNNDLQNIHIKHI